MTGTVIQMHAHTGFTVYTVQVDGTARPGIVPGYPGSELMEVTIRDDNSTMTDHLTRGRYGYRPNMPAVRAAAVRAARSHAKAAA